MSYATETRYVGALSYGQASPRTLHPGQPKYLAFKFMGKPGDQVSIHVSSLDGDPVAWLLDSTFQQIAFNDDASASSTDSLVRCALPANANPQAQTYGIYVREYSMQPFNFVVRLDGGASPLPTPHLTFRIADWVRKSAAPLRP